MGDKQALADGIWRRKDTGAIDAMLERLGLEYIDLLYIHQPIGDYVGAWKDMEKAYEQGKVRALGISNCDAKEEAYNAIVEGMKIKPAVHQIECHPYAQRLDMRKTGKVLYTVRRQK